MTGIENILGMPVDIDDLLAMTRQEMVEFSALLESVEQRAGFRHYQFDPAAYIERHLGWRPWGGTQDAPGQMEIIEAYTLALQKQHEKDAWEKEEIEASELKYWSPGEVIKNRIRVEAGHTVGKTKVCSGLVSHFFDCFVPSIVYCFAPTYGQINDLLFKEIRVDRARANLPGRVMSTPDIKLTGDRFVKGVAASDAHGRGTERVQGQHGKYLMFVLDEAEGIQDFVWDAVDSMTSGGITIVLMLANPRTRVSRFYKARNRPSVENFRISCLNHPNVLEDREIIPGAVRRDYITEMLKHTEEVPHHSPDDHTFSLPWEPDVILRPNAEFLFRVLGIAPANLADNVFCPTGRYEAAVNRDPYDGDGPHIARVGVDVARYGNDNGTIYIRHAGRVWKAWDISKQDGYEYYLRVKEECLKLAKEGVTDCAVRVDGGGGYGSTCIDNLRRDVDVIGAFDKFLVLEVHNNGTPSDPKQFADLVTEMYYSASEALKILSLTNPPNLLQEDLTERTYAHVLKQGVDVKRLENKERFKSTFQRSPDDGDGFCLAVAPDYIFAPVPAGATIDDIDTSIYKPERRRRIGL